MKVTLSKYKNKCFNDFYFKIFNDYVDGFYGTDFYFILHITMPSYLISIGLKK